MIKEVTAGKIMVPGAQLFNRLVSALRRQEPTVALADEVDVFDRMQAQLEAIQELRVWRAVRDMAPELQGCPPQPRLIRHVISPEEETHIKDCAYCRSVLKKAKVGRLTLWFEKLEQRWLRFKETTASFHIRVIQAGILMVLIAALLMAVTYPLHLNTERMLNNMKVEVNRANAYAEEITKLQRDRDRLMSNLTQLHSIISTLDKRSERNQAEQRDLVRQLGLVTKELNALQSKHQDLFLPGIAQEHSVARISGRVGGLQARSTRDCMRCGVQVFQGKKK